MWRNQLQDEALLSSLSEDLKLFWRLKATRWDELSEKIGQQVRSENILGDPGGIEQKKKLREVLKYDDDYVSLKERIKDQRDEAKEIFAFLEIKIPKELQTLKFTKSLIDFPIIEEAVEVIDEFIPYCHSANYWWFYLLQAWKSPKQFLNDLRSLFTT